MPTTTPHADFFADDHLRRRVAWSAKLYGDQAVLVIDRQSQFCPRCHFGLPTHDLQIVRQRPIFCQICGTILKINK